MKLSDYYRAYYNGHHFRDVVCRIKTPSGHKAYELKYQPAADSRILPYEKFRRFIINPSYHKSNADFMAGISHYPNYLKWESHNTLDVVTDRLFFDFDYKTDASKDIAKKVTNALEGNATIDGNDVRVTGSERSKLLKKYRKEYQQLIFKEDLLLPVYNQTMEFIKLLEDELHLKSYLTMSGSSGFHVNIFMPDQELPYINYVRKMLHDTFYKKYNFNFMDDMVLDAATRKQRVPYSKNPKSDLYVRPIPSDISYDEMLKVAKSRKYKLHDFSIEDYYANAEFIDTLHYLDKKGKAAAIHEKEVAAMNLKKMPKYNGNKIFKGMIDISKPEDVMKLLSFQCFKSMEWSDKNNLLLVNLLWHTNLKTAEDIQKAMIYYWNHKGISLKQSAAGLKRVKANRKGKYAPTNNTMKRNEYCKECKDWKECFRYKLILSDEYKERIHTYREKHNGIS